MVNQKAELKALFSIPFFPLRGEHTKMRTAGAHKTRHSVFKTETHLISNHEQFHVFSGPSSCNKIICDAKNVRRLHRLFFAKERKSY